jgi:4'-phosphopantetheinyl transferase
MIVNNWRDLTGKPVLARGVCQLWLAWLDEEEPESFRNTLSPDEQLRAGRLRSPQNADRFSVGRGILRAILGRYLSSSPERLVFSYGPHGKPDLSDGLQEQLSFNVSHSEGLAVYAIANGFEIGVDVEKIHPVTDPEAAASIFLSPDELTEYMSFPANGKLERFFTLWTSKEAILKASGVGFSNPDRDIFATFRESSPCVDGQNVIFKNKQLTLFDPEEGFKGALACL